MRALVVVVALAAGPALALEGKWTPEQVLELDRAMLKREGLELAPERLWDAKRGTGLLAGAVNLNGCSGAFISGTGLIVTNHHCVFSIVAEHSTPERDLITNGFIAATRADELHGKGSRLRVPKAFVDVTARVNGAVPKDADDLKRFQAIDRAQKEIVAECEQKPATRCDVATFWGGLQYVLMVQTELSDVRLVYAPPRAVGEFGGEVDNWMWPRHTGDFAIVRAYAAPDGAPAAFAPTNVALKPEFFFPLSEKGVAPGDFVMVLGYPGFTVRDQLHEEMELRARRFYPRVADWSQELIAILESIDDPAGKIAVASQLKSLHNRMKNARGQIDGIERGRLLDKKRTADLAVVKFAESNAAANALAGRKGLLDELERRAADFERELLVSQILTSSRALSVATTIARMASERTKPDLERDPAYMERERARLLDQLEREQKNIHAPADKRVLHAFVKRAQALDADHRIAAVDAIFGKSATDKALTKKIDALFAGSKVLTLDDRKRMAGEELAVLQKRNDKLLALGLAMNGELDRQKREDDRRSGASARLRPPWLQTVLHAAGKPVAPDANRTLRVTFAKVRGYTPRDGVVYQPQTTLSGLLEKQRDTEPFIVPAKVRAAADKRALSGIRRWSDPGLNDVPVNFLADADTTGGNSGSPVVNGKGELVGVNFDRVWENVANDFGYNPSIARNVSVDVRYMLWMLDEVDGAKSLLTELGVR